MSKKTKQKLNLMTQSIANQASTEQRHQTEWQASQIPQAIIERNFRTYHDPREVDELLNFNTTRKWKHSVSLVPGWGVSGVDPKTGERWRKGAQYKPDIPITDFKSSKERKYLSPYKQTLSPLFLEVEDPQYWPKLIKDVGTPIIITEGAKKAGSVLGQGHPCISLPGVTTGGKLARLRRELTYFCKYGRPIYLAFDRDIVTKPAVFRALHNLGRMIAAKGAMVYVLEWPNEHKGMDDFIAAGGIVQERIDKASTLEEWRESLLEADDFEEEERCPLARKYALIDKKLQGRIQWNELRGSIEIDGEPCDFSELRLSLAIKFNITISALDCEQILLHIARRYPYHPVRQYLMQCAETYPPDPELLNLLSTQYFGCDSELHTVYVRKTLISAVARALDPGCKVDTVLILQGPQGARKSSWFKVLASEDWFDDSFQDASDKDERMKLHTCWVAEWGELESVFKRKDVSRVKAFITTATDAIRPPYGKFVEQWPRPSIIVGSTNEDEFLADPTGSRRFWVIPVTERGEDAPINTDQLAEDRDRIWAAAVHAYQQGESWRLPNHLVKAAQEQNQEYSVSDPWESAIEDYIESRTYVSVDEILKTCLHVDLDKQTRGQQMRCSNLLKRLGWNKKRSRINGKSRNYWFPNFVTNEVGTVGTMYIEDDRSTDNKGFESVPTSNLPLNSRSADNKGFGSVPTFVPTSVPTSVQNQLSVPVECDNQGVPTVPTSNPRKKNLKNTLKVEEDEQGWFRCDCEHKPPVGVMAKVIGGSKRGTIAHIVRVHSVQARLEIEGGHAFVEHLENIEVLLDGSKFIAIDGLPYKIVRMGIKYRIVVKGDRGRKRFAYNVETKELREMKDNANG